MPARSGPMADAKVVFHRVPERVIGQACMGTESAYSAQSRIVKLREFLCPL
jgi:hypothetical protein